MRIGQVDQQNYIEIMKMLSSLNKQNKVPQNLTDLFDDYAKESDSLPDQNEKNPYGVEGMNITGRTDWKKIIPVTGEMVEHVINDAKTSYYKYFGMTGGIKAEDDAFHGKIIDYVKTLDPADRSPATWTLNQVHFNVTDTVTAAIRERIPNWKHGDVMDTKILDEIFSDESITQKFTQGIPIKGGFDRTV